MIKTIKHHYQKLPGLKKYLMGIAFFLAAFITTFRFIHADTLPFEDNLSSIFSWLNTGYYSNTYFKFGGNDFVGIIFREGTETLSTPETVSINSGAQAISCTQKLKGIYYNNQRGWVIRPLNTGNLSTLQTSPFASGYDDMSMQHGFYTNCNALSGGYTPASNEVYGQIDHTLSGVGEFHMFAGVEYDFTGNVISGAVFDHTLTIISGVHNGYIFDDNGGIAELSMNLPRCANFSMGPTSFTQGSTATFICEGNSIAGYGLSIRSGGIQSMYDDSTSNTGSSQRWLTGNALPVGHYTAQCLILLSGGGGMSCGSSLSFEVTTTGTIPATGTACDPNFQGEISFLPVSAEQFIINPSLGTYYTNNTGIILQWAATQPNQISISGDLTPQISSNYTGNDIFNDIASYPVSLTKLNDWNYVYSTYTTTGSTGACTYTDATKRIFMDTIPPTHPILSTPVNGSYLCPSTPMTVTWTPSTDTGSLLSHYAYEIYSNTGMTNIVLSGTVPSTITTTQIALQSLPLGTYYLRIAAVDNVGLKGYSTGIQLTTSPSYCPSGTGIMIVSPIISITNADLDTVYRSDPIYIFGLTGPTLLSISTGTLFINTHTGVGTTGMVSSNDTIYIELISSNEYNETVSSELTILGKTGTFFVTTKDSNCSLSAGEKLIIENIYADLKEEYNNDISKYSEFLNTFQNMVEDESEISNSCTLEYLLQLIEDDFGSEGINTNNHITPNCKEYTIGYATNERAYYSPDMTNRYYFINRESLIRHLDYYNPGDCHINTYGNNHWAPNEDPMLHIAPNGKLYHLVGQYGGYSAEEFTTPKYFDSLQGINTYIDLKNPAKEIWTHTIDTIFIPIVYAAPNGKEYKIYKTNRGFMSYKLMKVRYFTSLSEIKSYIDKNNPSKR